MDQPPLFVESVYDALKGIVQAIGGTKAVGALLWPEKSMEDARRRLLDCLNPDRDEKFDVQQVILLLRLAREANFHLAKHWIDQETGYVPSEPADPKVEQEKLVATIERATAELHRAVDALDKLRGRSGMKAVA